MDGQYLGTHLPLIIPSPAARLAERQEEGRVMSGTRATEAAVAACAAVASRWEALDPLLPEPDEPTKTCGTNLDVTSPDGRVVAAGACRHVRMKPGSLEMAWGAARQFALTPRVAWPDVGDGLDQLLKRWRAHLARQDGASDHDSAAVLRWPSRDVGGVRALLEHGLRPLTVIAARPAGRPIDGPASPGDLRIRAARRGDLDALELLGLEMMRYDACFGSVVVRPDTAGNLRETAAQWLSAPQPWAWVAEREGEPVGMVHAEPPEAAGWVAPLVRARPAAYLGEMSVLPGARGAGVGTALVRHLHRELDATGAAVTLLHHAQLNPLSAPFWNRMGYRPLWTLWEVRPADCLS
jgi:GNAT superfamily N-acetyltransferase